MSTHFPARGDEPVASRLHPTLYNLVYCSRATAGVDASAVDDIIASARRHNPKHGITGMLVFGSGVFMQWLEGPHDNVTALMALLREDPRHQDIVQLSESEEVRERLFPEWDMELVGSDHIREVLLDARDSAIDPKNAKALGLMLASLDAHQIEGSEPA